MGNFMTGVYNLVHDKKFWLALISVALIVIRAQVPGFPLSDEMISMIVLTIVSLIFGIGFTELSAGVRGLRNQMAAQVGLPQPIPAYPFLTDKKFWLAVIAVLLIVIKAFVPTFPLSDSDFTKIVLTFVALIFGVSFNELSGVMNGLRYYVQLSSLKALEDPKKAKK